MVINKPNLIQPGTSVSLQELSSFVLYILIEKLVNNPVTVEQGHNKKFITFHKEAKKQGIFEQLYLKIT